MVRRGLKIDAWIVFVRGSGSGCLMRRWGLWTLPRCLYPREVVKRSLVVNAAAVIFAHNHPSGVGEASRADELLTQSLKQALALVDVKVLDHFLIAGSGVMSFAERGLL